MGFKKYLIPVSGDIANEGIISFFKDRSQKKKLVQDTMARWNTMKTEKVISEIMPKLSSIEEIIQGPVGKALITTEVQTMIDSDGDNVPSDKLSARDIKIKMHSNIAVGYLPNSLDGTGLSLLIIPIKHGNKSTTKLFAANGIVRMVTQD